jgi:hypothetical protein
MLSKGEAASDKAVRLSMGIEYRIRFDASPSDLERRIRVLRFFVNFDSKNCLYLLHVGPAKDEKSVNGWVVIKEDGLYFCDNLGGTSSDRATIFRAVIDLALEQSHTIEVEQL